MSNPLLHLIKIATQDGQIATQLFAHLCNVGALTHFAMKYPRDLKTATGTQILKTNLYIP